MPPNGILIKPTQRSLDAMCRGVDRVHVRERDQVGDSRFPSVALVLTDRDSIEALLEHLRIVERDETRHCMCVGSLILEFIAEAGVVGIITVHHGRSIRWSMAWDSDAQLLDGGGLAKWLADHGVDSLLREWEELERERIKEERALASWFAAAPPGLGLSSDSFEVPQVFNQPLEPVLAGLNAAHEDEEAVILALCRWHGTLGGPWSEHYMFELLPVNLLAMFGPRRVLRALEGRVLESRHLEGAARYLASAGGPYRMSSAIAEAFRSHGRGLADPEKRATIARLIGEA